MKQNFFQCLEDLAHIWLDPMRLHYGVRRVPASGGEGERPFDFGALDALNLSVKLDVGGSAYWSEIAQINTWTTC